MKLHSPEFERQLKRGVRQALRSSPELRKGARRTGAPKQYSLRILVRPGMAVMLALAVWWISKLTGKPAAALAAISLWMFLWLCSRARQVLDRLYTDPQLETLSFLPLGPDSIFQWQMQKFFRASVWSLVDLCAALFAFGWYQGLTPGKWLALLAIALLAWVMLLALALLGASRWPRLPYGLVTGAGVLLGFACLFGREYVATRVVKFIDHYANELNLFLPTGWPGSLARVLVEPDQWLTLLLLVPMAGVLWTVKSSLARLRENYEFHEVTVPESPDLLPEEAASFPSVTETQTQTPQHLGVTAIEEIILSRRFFAGPKWYETGPVEKWLWLWFSPRERTVSEFVFPSGFMMTTPWKKIFRHMFVVLLVVYLLGLVSPDLRLWVLCVGLFVTFCQSLGQILKTGTAFQPVPCSGVNIPRYAAYAISFHELARLLFKCSFVQLPLFIPFITIGTVPLATLAGLSVLEGIVLGIKAGVLLLAVRFITVTFAFSSGTNDTTRFRFRSLVLLAAVIGSGLFFMGLGAAGLFVPSVPVALVSLILAVLDAYALFRIYGWFYHANRFDLMKPDAE